MNAYKYTQPPWDYKTPTIQLEYPFWRHFKHDLPQTNIQPLNGPMDTLWLWSLCDVRRDN